MYRYVADFQRIDEIGKRAGSAETDELLRAHIARYICVLIAGTLENACSELLGDYARRTANERTGRYVRDNLAKLQNTNPTKIENLLAAFDPEWSVEIQTYWNGQIRDAVASVVNNRHLIAHGKSVGVSLVQALKWSKDAKLFCEKLESITKR